MNGPYDYDAFTLNREIIHTQSGDYALGYLNFEKTAFIIEYVGRSDSDVGGKLKEHLPSKYTLFKYRYTAQPKTSQLKDMPKLSTIPLELSAK